MYQIQVCNDNIHGLKRTYANVANRGEVTKEVIENSVLLGTISFSGRGVILSYSSKSKNEYPNSLLLFSNSILLKSQKIFYGRHA